MAKYDEYRTIKVTLSDILEDLHEFLDQNQGAILFLDAKESSGEPQLMTMVGRIQGIHKALKRLEHRFGVQDE